MATPQRRKSRLLRGDRLQIMLSTDELQAVDDYRFRNRMPSRAAAVRELFRLGLASAGLTRAVGGRKSADFGVLGDVSGDAATAAPAASPPNE